MFEEQRKKAVETKEKVVKWIKKHKVALGIGGAAVGGAVAMYAKQKIEDKIYYPVEAYLEVGENLYNPTTDARTIVNVHTVDRFGNDHIEGRIGYDDDEFGRGRLRDMAAALTKGAQPKDE